MYGDGRPATQEEVIKKYGERALIFLGEHHANPAHHQWQLSMLEQLRQRQPNMVLAMESFPKRAQPVLDAWVRGELKPAQLRRQSKWDYYWFFDFELYLPLFDFARRYGIPLVALNVDRELVARIGKEGWAGVPLAERENIGMPARPSRAYVTRLATSFRQHRPAGTDSDKDRRDFKRFVDQQLLWDRAMAQRLAEAYQRYKPGQLVAIIGSWHLAGGLGVPEQLKNLLNQEASIYLPWDDNFQCDALSPSFADAVFIPVELRP